MNTSLEASKNSSLNERDEAILEIVEDVIETIEGRDCSFNWIESEHDDLFEDLLTRARMLKKTIITTSLQEG